MCVYVCTNVEQTLGGNVYGVQYILPYGLQNLYAEYIVNEKNKNYAILACF